MSFFTNVFGFDEGSDYDVTAKRLLELATITTATDSDSVLYRHCRGEKCVFKVGEQTVDAGIFSEPSVREIRSAVQQAVEENRQAIEEFRKLHAPKLISVDHVVGDSRTLHSEPQFANSVVQAASQFNYLEFPSPHTIPENGINDYMYDRTQGPACAIACAAGTAFRNYLVKMGEARGQRQDRQLDGLGDITKALSADDPLKYYTVKNGYVESTADRLAALNARFKEEPELVQELPNLLRIAVQQDTQVTDDGVRTSAVPVHVTQTYNAALSIGYSRLQSYTGDGPWDTLAQIVQNGTYEATLLVGVLHTIRAIKNGATAPPPILLTKVGGGVFANKREWIFSAMERAMEAVAVFQVPLDIRVVHYGGIERGWEVLPQLRSGHL